MNDKGKKTSAQSNSNVCPTIKDHAVTISANTNSEKSTIESFFIPNSSAEEAEKQ